MLDKRYEGLAGRINVYFIFVFSLFILIFLSFSYYFLLNKNVEVLVRVEVDTPGSLQFFWKDTGGDFSENNSTRVEIVPDKIEYFLKIAPYIAIDRLRVDLIDRQAEVRLQELVFFHQAYQPFSPIMELFTSQTTQQIGSRKRTSDGGLLVSMVGNDPYIEISVAPEVRVDLIAYIMFISFAGGLLLSLLVDTTLLKGSFRRARMVVVVPGIFRQAAAEMFVDILTVKTGNNCRLLSIEECNGQLVYQFSFYWLVDRDMLQLSRELSRCFPDAEYRFQYARSGEV